MQEIIQKLEEYCVMADRKTLFVDFDELCGFGANIIMEKISRNSYYYLIAHDAENNKIKRYNKNVTALIKCKKFS